MIVSKTVGIFVGVFILPLALAYAVLKLEWLPTSTVNKGRFVQPELSLVDWRAIQPKPWAIGMITPERCDKLCLEQHKDLQNLYMALGKNREKVDLVLLGASAQSNSDFKAYPLAPNQLKQGSLYLIDKMGLVLLEYPIMVEPQANRIVQKGLLKDLKKLINYSRK